MKSVSVLVMPRPDAAKAYWFLGVMFMYFSGVPPPLLLKVLITEFPGS